MKYLSYVNGKYVLRETRISILDCYKFEIDICEKIIDRVKENDTDDPELLKEYEKFQKLYVKIKADYNKALEDGLI